MKKRFSFALFAVLLLSLRSSILAGPLAQVNVTKAVSFAVLEDYDKGDDLNDVALDFRLLNELGINEMRCSFGWDDYEPRKGQYDFDWLKQFVALAQQYGIQLRPYLAYTARWAGLADMMGFTGMTRRPI